MREGIKNVYIHLPFCLKKCHFCAFPIHAIGQHALHTQHTNSMLEKYMSSLKKEVQLSTTGSRSNILTSSHLETIYFGGGTPSLFHPYQIGDMIKFLRGISKSSSSEVPEITLELNPEEIERIPDFHSAGINRFSIGIQSFNSLQLRKFNRVTLSYKHEEIRNNNKSAHFITQLDRQSDEYMEKIASTLQRQMRENKLKNFNVDFIVDLNPSQRDQERILKFIERIKPPHLTVYLLEVIENTYLEKRIRNSLPKQTISQSRQVQGYQQNQGHQSRHHNNDFKQQHEFKQLVKGFHQIHDKYIRFSDKLKTLMGFSHYQVSNFALRSNPVDSFIDGSIGNFVGQNINGNTNKQNIKAQEQMQSSVYESKHNQVYWKGNTQFIGFGMGASSLLTYSNINPYFKRYLNNVESLKTHENNPKDFTQQMFRVTNPKTIAKYYQYIQSLQKLSASKKQDQIITQNQVQKYSFVGRQKSQRESQINVKEKQQRDIEIHLQSFPVGILQSYILSAIRTQKGVLFSQIHRLLTSRQQIEEIDSQKLDSQQKVLKKKMLQILSTQLEDLSKLHPYFQFIYENQQTNHEQIQNFSVNQKSKIKGFRLLSPYGYLIADEIGNRLAVELESIFR